MSNATCGTEILDSTLSMPNIGICEKNSTILLITCFVTFVIQFARHWLWDQTSVVKYNILSKKRGSRCSTSSWTELEPVLRYMAIQLGKTLLWVVSLLIIVNANWLVITIHIVADVFSCCFWILRTQRFDKNPLDVQRIMEAIKEKPGVWKQFIITSAAYDEFKRQQEKLPQEMQDEQGHDGAFSNSDSASAPTALWRRTQTLNF